MPVMNQEDHIERVLKEHHDAMLKLGVSFEIIAVINDSRDRSFEKSQNIAQKYEAVFSYEIKKGGYGRGILHGLERARGEYLCYLNSARIHAHELATVLQFFLSNPKCIVHGVRSDRKTHRKIGSFIYNTFCRFIFKLRAHDVNGNPNVFSRATYEKLQLQSTDSMIDLELLDKANKYNIPIVEVPVYDYSRHGGRSTTSFKTIFRLMKEAARYWIATRLVIK